MLRQDYNIASSQVNRISKRGFIGIAENEGREEKYKKWKGKKERGNKKIYLYMYRCNLL